MNGQGLPRLRSGFSFSVELQLFLRCLFSPWKVYWLFKNVKSLFFSLQKPLRAREYLLNKLSLGRIFLFSVLKLNKSWYLNTILKSKIIFDRWNIPWNVEALTLVVSLEVQSAFFNVFSKSKGRGWKTHQKKALNSRTWKKERKKREM